MTAAQFAYHWVLRNQIVSSVIAGPRTLAQWQEYVDGVDKRSTRRRAFIDQLVRPGPSVDPGYNDPQ
jgi:aryl-alcohol dehydrogenase-like predicted oxidoreductase